MHIAAFSFLLAGAGRAPLNAERRWTGGQGGARVCVGARGSPGDEKDRDRDHFGGEAVVFITALGGDGRVPPERVSLVCETRRHIGSMAS